MSELAEQNQSCYITAIFVEHVVAIIILLITESEIRDYYWDKGFSENIMTVRMPDSESKSEMWFNFSA